MGERASDTWLVCTLGSHTSGEVSLACVCACVRTTCTCTCIKSAGFSHCYGDQHAGSETEHATRRGGAVDRESH